MRSGASAPVYAGVYTFNPANNTFTLVGSWQQIGALNSGEAGQPIPWTFNPIPLTNNKLLVTFATTGEKRYYVILKGA